MHIGSDHQPRQLQIAAFGRYAMAGYAPAAQHRGALAQRAHLAELVADEEDAAAFGGQALAVVSGSLAPDGAVIKTAAATPELLQHTGPAVVFDSPADAAARIDDPALGITADHVIVLRNAGPVAAGIGSSIDGAPAPQLTRRRPSWCALLSRVATGAANDALSALPNST